MELTHDWRAFQDVFYPNHRANPGKTPAPAVRAPIFVVTEEDLVISAYSESEDLTGWVGASVTDLRESFGKGRVIHAYERAKVDQWLGESVALPHFYDQVEHLREKCASKQRRHFLLEAIHGWWARVLPSSYGILLATERDYDQSLLVIVRRGKVDGFFHPDLTFLKTQNRCEPAEIVKYLSQKHLVRVQGIFVDRQEWAEWTKSPDPWRELARSVKASRTRLVPFRMSIATLITTRAFLRI